MSETELNPILFDLNQTTSNYPINQTIHQLFEIQVELTPDAIAVVQEHQQISYETLNQKANQLAHYLQKHGIKPESLVGLCVERSLEMVIALLGILKAGGAYVPLDPQYPQERLDYMILDAQVSVIITQSHLVDKLGSGTAKIICLGENGSEIARESPTNPNIEVQPENLAYVIYTSGSTGKPKGVMIEHRSVVNFIEAFKIVEKISHSDRVLQFASINFDVAVEEIYSCLSLGATVVLRTEEMLSSFSTFMQKCREWQLTVLDLPTAFWQALITELDRTQEIFPESVKLIVIGGESFLPEKLKQWQRYTQKISQSYQRWQPPRLINAYGPTETTVEATVCDLTTYNLLENSTSVPIGRPLQNAKIYILNGELQPETPGELYIGGMSLARGYLNRPDLTAEKFILNPFNPSERLYKTGDLGRYLEDGNIEYLGRIDNQVKIRGFRVELGEIESILAQHPVIDQAVVIVSENQLGDKHLVAYIVAQLDPVEQEKAQQEYINIWRTVNQQTDRKTLFQPDITFNVVGWDSSYDGQPIPEREMQEWVEHTVARIMDLKPNKVLEIGCGTGLLLTRIAPHCTEYVGIDYSGFALEHIRKTQQERGGLDNISLFERTADNLEGFELEYFDTIIINSVLQYFPNVAYLLQVLEGTIKLVKKGGHILLGDVRNLALLEAYCTSIEVYQAHNNLLASQLKTRIARRQKAEEELLLAPDFFLALQQIFPEITHVQIKPKPGRYHNELTRFRYEAILHIHSLIQPLREIQWLDWQQQELSLTEIKSILTENKPTNLGISNIPNQRLEAEVYVKQWLEQAGKEDSIKNLHQWLLSQPSKSIEIDSILQLGEEFSYQVEISWLRTNETGSYDVVFTPNSLPFQPAIFPISTPLQSISVYANNPLQTKFNQQLISQLRQFLQEKLPEYMIPSAFGILEQFPLTPNDKIDRQALAKLPVESYLLSENTSDFVAPRNPEEEILASLWAEILQLDKIGIHDNFFALGGNSLKVIILLNWIQEKFNKNLQMVDLFKSPTIAELAPRLQEKSETIQNIALRSHQEIRYFPPSFLQERFWNYRQLGSFYHLPNYYYLKGNLNITVLEKSFNEIIRRHEILRTKLQEIKGSLMQVVAVTEQVNLSVIELLNLPESERIQAVEILINQEKQRFVKLDQDPWLRVILFRLSEQSHILLIGLHYLMSDERSTEILLKELGIFYEAFRLGKPDHQPELPLQYGDYALAQRQSLTEDVLQTRRNYWQKWLNQEPQPLTFPTDKPLLDVPTFQAETRETQLSVNLSTQLKILSQKQQVTLFTTLAAAWGCLLSHYSGCESLVIGVPMTERNHLQFNSLIGDFGKMGSLKLDLSENPSFLTLLERIRQEMLALMTYQDVPFEQVKNTLQSPVKRDRPFFRVYLDYLLEAPKTGLELSGLSVTDVPIKGSMARLDLGLIIWTENQSSGANLNLWWRYKKDLFETQTIAEMESKFEKLLEAIIASPELPISLLRKE